MIFKRRCICSKVFHRLKSQWAHVPKSSQVVDIGNGSSVLTFKTGEIARFADGSVEVQIGGTSVLSVVVWRAPSSDQNKAIGFVPLTISYRQQLASLGRIPLSYDRKDRFDSPSEILTGRLIDRCLRPAFDASLSRSEFMPSAVEVTCCVLCDDYNNNADVVAINAASLSLGMSSLPKMSCVGAVRVAMDAASSNFILNPTTSQRQQSDIDLVLSCDVNGNIAAIQSGCNKAPKDVFIEAVKMGSKWASELAIKIEKFIAENNNKERVEHQRELLERLKRDRQVAADEVFHLSKDRILKVLADSSHHKFSRDTALKAVKDELYQSSTTHHNATEHEKDGKACIENMQQKQKLEKEKNEVSRPNEMTIRNHWFDRDEFEQNFIDSVRKCLKLLAFDSNKRCDGRNLKDLRPIECKTSLYPTLHGSSLFSRGQTQVLCRLTFDSITSSQRLDPISSAFMKGQLRKQFMLHYQFPKFSVNDFTLGKFQSNRRELGHGNLAEMGIAPLVPNNYKFAIRLLTEVLESNGSSSMASVCAASLALMDAGVEISEHAAGIAIGLLTQRSQKEEDTIDKHVLLTDILGFEDFYGEMDFKIVGTKSETITALQCDVKKHAIPLKIAIEAIEQGMEAIKEVIDKMAQEISACRDVSQSPDMPQLKQFEVAQYQIASVLGAGRMNVKHLEDKGCVFTIEQEPNHVISVFAPNRRILDEVTSFMKDKLDAIKEPVLQFGQICNAKVERVSDKGVYVSIYQGQNPLVFISNFHLHSKNISHPSAVGLQSGKTFKVKYFGRDPANGRMRLSRRALLLPASDLPSVDFVSDK